MRLKQIGQTVEVVDLAAEGFNPVFGPADHAAFSASRPMPADVLKEQQRLDRADHLILVYPINWWSMRALLKGWIDRVFISGWASEEGEGDEIVKKLGRLKVHLFAIAGAARRTCDKRGYWQAMQIQIQKGLFDFAARAS